LFFRAASHAESFFFLTGRILQGAQILFWGCLVTAEQAMSGRHAELFFGHSHALVQGAQFFWECPLAAAQQRQARRGLSGRCPLSFDSPRNNFFVTGRICTSCVSPRSK
jgi:hypothetical protein